MAESWATLASYRLHDLLMFSVDTYYRLFELVNRRWWPAPVAGTLLALLVLLAAIRRQAAPFALALLALAWCTVALLYFLGGFSDIHALGAWWMGAFLLQAPLWLLWLVMVQPVFATRLPARSLGLLLLWAGTAWPMLALVLRNIPWQAEVVGLAPDATVLLSLGLLTTLQPSRRWAGVLLLVPLAWCGFTGATLWALQQPHALVLPLACAAVVLVRVYLR